MKEQSTVFIVDHDEAFLESISNLVTAMGFAVERYRSGEEYLAAFNQDRSGCLILDVNLPGIGGLEVLEELAAKPIAVPAIIVTGQNAVPVAVRAMRLGVEAYLQKQAFAETALWESIHAALTRDAVQREAYVRRGGLLQRLSTLNERERIVLEMLVQGYDNTSIADILGVSRRTIENRRARVMQKLSAANFPQLIAMAIEAGLPTQRF